MSPTTAPTSAHTSAPGAAVGAESACYACERLIRFSDCDPAGIVFYPQYFVMLNGVVEDWFTHALGLNYATLIGPRRIGLPTVHLEADFKAVSRHGDMVRLLLSVERLGARSMTLQVRCVGAQDGQLRMAVRLVIVTTSLLSHQAIDIPADLREAIARHAGIVQ